jgi:osmotically-inducible protein OsmY
MKTNAKTNAKTDAEIRADVEEELRWNPSLDATNIAIAVKDGVVELAGFVPGYVQKYEAETSVKRVAGVVGVANDLEVRVPAVDQRPDADIARDAVEALRTQLPLSSDNIKVLVADGWITLEGNTEWNYQKDRAEKAVRWLRGAKGVINSVEVQPTLSPDEIRHRIEEAFRRSAEVDADRIEVEAHEGKVILKGTVRSWYERTEAERAAWSAPGVRRVEDRIVVRP